MPPRETRGVVVLNAAALWTRTAQGQLVLGNRSTGTYSSALRLGCSKSSLRFSDQDGVLRRPEANIGLGFATDLGSRELQADRDSKRRLVEAELGHEGVIGDPGPACCPRLLGQAAPGEPAFLPCAAPANDPT